jgi:S-adenosylmethionine hydrolase
VGTVITLTTDFGLNDAYVAALKGVILSINPEVTLVDICHNIRPQNIRQAAFLISTVCDYFPYQTVHLVVVDPGVGTSRRPLILKTPRAFFVAPDNGVLSYIIHASTSTIPTGEERVKLGGNLKAYVINKSEYWLSPVSNTFHGRDIFAPVAARLSLGMPPSSLGTNVDTITAFRIPVPYREEDRITGEVLHVDNFGNLITNIRENDLPPAWQKVNIVIGNHVIDGVVQTYAEGQDLIALFGSSGYLEISRKNGNAASFLNLDIGEKIIVQRR